MDRFPNQTFAGPTFSGDQNGRKDARDFVNNIVHTVHSRAATEEAVDAASAEHLLGGGELADHSRAAAGAIDGEAELLHIKRLLEEVDGAVAKKLERGCDLIAPAEGDDRRREGQLGRHAQHVALRLLVAGKVQQDCVNVAAAEFRDRLFGSENLADVVTGIAENFLEDVAESFVLVDEKDTLNSFAYAGASQNLPHLSWPGEYFSTQYRE